MAEIYYLNREIPDTAPCELSPGQFAAEAVAAGALFVTGAMLAGPFALLHLAALQRAAEATTEPDHPDDVA